MKPQTAPKLIEHDYYPLEQAQADREYDELLADGFHSYAEQNICREMEERSRRGY